MPELLLPNEPCPVCRESLRGYDGSEDEFPCTEVKRFERVPLASLISQATSGDSPCYLDPQNARVDLERILGDARMKLYFRMLEGICWEGIPMHLWNLLPPFPRHQAICSQFWPWGANLSLGLRLMGRGKSFDYDLMTYGMRWVGDESDQIDASPVAAIARMRLSRSFPRHV